MAQIHVKLLNELAQKIIDNPEICHSKQIANMLYRIALKLKDPAYDIEDLLSEVVVSCLEQYRAGNIPTNPTAYIIKSLFNKCGSINRHYKKFSRGDYCILTHQNYTDDAHHELGYIIERIKKNPNSNISQYMYHVIQFMLTEDVKHRKDGTIPRYLFREYLRSKKVSYTKYWKKEAVFLSKLNRG
jgi:Glu-tRNA(Gln) amidotransferase subunit E-like FAD-binding protein